MKKLRILNATLIIYTCLVFSYSSKTFWEYISIVGILFNNILFASLGVYLRSVAGEIKQQIEINHNIEISMKTVSILCCLIIAPFSFLVLFLVPPLTNIYEYVAFICIGFSWFISYYRGAKDGFYRLQQ